MSIKMENMGIFTRVNDMAADQIVQIAHEGPQDRLNNGGTFSKFNIFRFMRSQATQDANNATRRQLLTSLGATFGLQQLDRAALVGRLTELLGNDVLKSDDFGLNGNGEVASGRPLTARRIQAIVTKVEELAARERTPGVANVTTEVISRRGELLKDAVARPFVEWAAGTHPTTYVDRGEVKTANIPFRMPRRDMLQNENIREDEIEKLCNALKVTTPKTFGEKRRTLLTVFSAGLGVIQEPFIKEKVIDHGVGKKGSDYLKEVVARKLDELIEAFNNAHPELALG